MSIDAKRPDIPGDGCQHAGLALHRCLAKQDSPDDESGLLKQVSEITVPAPYRAAYQRWVAATPGADSRIVLELTLAAPMTVGLGNESVLETGLTLHHTYGVPVIPGSAVKGLCRRAAREGGVADEPLQALFGEPSSAGYCAFHDAWYVPGSANNHPLFVDVITPHHSRYQTGSPRKWPTDFDDPIPVHHLAVKPGAKFRFVVDIGPMEQMAAAKDLLTAVLRYAVSTKGVGGKTSSGYGMFRGESPNGGAGRRGAPAAETVTYENATVYRQKQGVYKIRTAAKVDIDGCVSGVDYGVKKENVTVTVRIDGNMKTIVKVEPAGR